ncbi:hypothetical protein ABT150_27155 [Streptomyces mirabilis]
MRLRLRRGRPAANWPAASARRSPWSTPSTPRAGRLTSVVTPDGTRRRYTYDPETGLHYNYLRHYDPETGW